MASATNPTLVTIVARVVLFCHGIPTQLLGMSASTYKSPVFIGLLGVMSVAMVLLLHHCILVACCNAGARDRRQRRRASAAARGSDAQQQQQPQDDASYSVDLSSSSRVQLVQAAVVCRYQKEEKWSEPTCPVCLADFADGEAVRVLPECMHYFHADCIDTWLRANTSCPMCRAETTPTPSPGSLHRQLSLSISLEDVPLRT